MAPRDSGNWLGTVLMGDRVKRRVGLLVRLLFVVCIGGLVVALIGRQWPSSSDELRFIPTEVVQEVKVASAIAITASARDVTGVNRTTRPLVMPTDQPAMDSLDPPDAPSSYWSASGQLHSGLIPANVHYIWCGRRWFQFKHYLSIVSVIRVMRPDSIWFHYQEEPVVDPEYYHQWIDLLKRDYPYFVMAHMTPALAEICDVEYAAQVTLVARLLDEMGGGLYMSENTWMLKFDSLKRRVDVEFALGPTSRDGYLLLREGEWARWDRKLDSVRRRATRSRSTSCSTVRHLYSGESKSACLTVDGGRYESFFPKDIWALDDVFGRLARRIFYGTEAIRYPKPTYDELVPNIAHMVWIGGGKMDFVFYLSVLSLLYVAGVDNVYIHGDLPPSGELWQRIEHEQSRVHFVVRTPVTRMYQNTVEAFYRPLMSDIIRVELMIRYGGIYTDTDAIWVRPLSHEERGYEAVATYDWVDWSYPYPDIVNFGVSYGKRDAPFWRIFRDSMRVMHNSHHGFTGVSMPYKLLELHPDLLRIDRHLSTICYKLKCHPIYANDYHNELKSHATMHTIKDWRTDLHAFHWTHPNPPEYSNETMLLESTGMFAEIGQYVLRKAGLS